eukprot:COSAG04_NODE_28407_length_276_cov_0.564972_1_plen_38_part_10
MAEGCTDPQPNAPVPYVAGVACMQAGVAASRIRCRHSK